MPLQVALTCEQLLAHRARIQRHFQLGVRFVVRVRRHVLDQPGLVAVPLVAYLAHVRLFAMLHLTLVDEVGQRSPAREHAPVVRVALVHVAVELLIIEALLLADLAGEVMRSRQRCVQLKLESRRQIDTE